MFYIVCKNLEERQALIRYLKNNQIHAVFHYLSLHKSDFYLKKHDGRELLKCDFYSDNLLRLPMFYELTKENINKVIDSINDFYL